jgi:hypothetical protein
MWGKVRTIFLVTLVTVLIWIWADAETQKDDLLHADGLHPAASDEAEMTVETLPVMIAMPAGTGSAGGAAKLEWARVHPQQTELKRVRIAGPRSVIDRIQGGEGVLRVAALLVLDEQDWQSASVSKGAELIPGGLGLHFVGPAPTVRVTIDR